MNKLNIERLPNGFSYIVDPVTNIGYSVIETRPLTNHLDEVLLVEEQHGQSKKEEVAPKKTS